MAPASQSTPRCAMSQNVKLTVPAASIAYTYASELVVYNRPRNLVVPIESAADMTEYLARYNPGRGDACPFGWPGNGVTILPRPRS